MENTADAKEAPVDSRPPWHWGRLPKVLILSLILIFGGSWLATWIQTGAGAASVKEVTYLGADNGINTAYLYIPNGVTAKNPAPGILAVHGFNNSLVMMSNTALELARRGYVVLNIDMEDHGLSDVVKPGDGALGALDGLNYLRSLPIVNKKLVGAVGMSMGGLEIDLATVMSAPGSVKSLYFMDSGCVATCHMPIDEALSVGTGTEFITLETGWAQVPGITQEAQLKSSAFVEKWAGTTQPVVEGQLYGSVSAGTARQFWEHFGDHPASTDDPATLNDVDTWFAETLGTPTPTSGLIFLWKDLGTALAGLGLFIFLFAFGGWLLRRRAFADLNEPTPEYKGNRGRMWWIFALITAIVGPLLFYWATTTGFDDDWFQWQEVTTAFAFWMGMIALVSIGILVAGYYLFARKAGMTWVHYGLSWAHGLDWKKIGKSALLGLAVGGTAYFVLVFVAMSMHVDMGVWVLPYQATNLGHFPFMVAYAIPVVFYFLVTSVVLTTIRVRNGEASLAREMVTNMVVLTLGIAVMLAIFYIPIEFFTVAPTTTLAWNMMSINGLGLIALLPVLAGLMTYYFRKTGHVFVGAFICTILVVTFLVGAETTFGV
jgi:MFS family permease